MSSAGQRAAIVGECLALNSAAPWLGAEAFAKSRRDLRQLASN